MARGEPGNTQIVALGLRNRSRAASGWNNETLKLEHSGPDGGPVEVESTQRLDVASLTHEQRDQLRQILLTRENAPCKKTRLDGGDVPSGRDC
jgi:hypothetical protein